MHKHLLVLSASMLLFACDQPSADLARERATLAELGSGLVAAEIARDLDAVMTYWAEDAMLQVNGSPQIEGKSAIRDAVGGMLSSFKEFEGKAIQIEVSASGDMAYELGINRVVFPGENSDLLAMGKYLAIWRKIGGGWQLWALSVTNDEPMPLPMDADQSDA